MCMLSCFSHVRIISCLPPYSVESWPLVPGKPLFMYVLTPRACSNSCPLSGWCHPIISSSVIPFSSSFQSLIFFRMDWLDLLAVQGNSQESSPTPQFKSINSSALSFLYSPTLSSIHDHWKNHSHNETDLCWQSNMLSRLVITFLLRSKVKWVKWSRSVMSDSLRPRGL